MSASAEPVPRELVEVLYGAEEEEDLDLQSSPAKAPPTRKRVQNFTPYEKALLVQLVKKRPIVESKKTDGKVIEKKKAAWDSITAEFNCNLHVNKRDTRVLKRAWDNLKAVARKRASQRGNLRAGGGPSIPALLPEPGVLSGLVKEAAPVLTIDCDGTIHQMETSNELSVDTCVETSKPSEALGHDIANPKIQLTETQLVEPVKNNRVSQDSGYQTRRPSETTESYVKREAVMRINHFHHKTRMERRILKAKLEVQEIKKRSALLEEEKITLELEELKKKLGK